MVSGVSFGLEGGESVFCPHPSLTIFIDETGHEALSDPTFPFFGYGGCLTYAGEYEKAIRKPWKEVERAFPSDMLPLHASELRLTRLTDAHFQGVSLFPIDASKVRLTLFALAARREGLEAAPRRSRPIVCRLVSLLHSCSRCDTPPPGRVAVLGC